MDGEASEVGVEVGLGVPPVERARGGVVAVLETEQSVLERSEVSEVARLDDFAFARWRSRSRSGSATSQRRTVAPDTAAVMPRVTASLARS
jgi:hypothetical protein